MCREKWLPPADGRMEQMIEELEEMREGIVRMRRRIRDEGFDCQLVRVDKVLEESVDMLWKVNRW